MAKTSPTARRRQRAPDVDVRANGRARQQRTRTTRLDFRWYLVASTVVIVAIVVGASLLGGGSTTGTGSAAPVGTVTETSLGGTPPAPGLLPVGSRAPDLQWTLGGKRESVAELRGTPALLVLLATWCPHCQAETPALSRISERYAPRGLRVVGVNSSPVGQDQRSPSSVEDLRSYANTYGARFPLLLDRELIGAKRYGIRSFPTIYLVDKNGVIQFVQSGEVPETTLADVVERALAGS
ncbi:MAG: TlpA family protein disulfide reductase [Chloroflexi bacterium]|nr:TlpA family protein disulfide reductase [Chloroflexota bacterium]